MDDVLKIQKYRLLPFTNLYFLLESTMTWQSTLFDSIMPDDAITLKPPNTFWLIDAGLFGNFFDDPLLFYN